MLVAWMSNLLLQDYTWDAQDVFEWMYACVCAGINDGWIIQQLGSYFELFLK